MAHSSEVFAAGELGMDATLGHQPDFLLHVWNGYPWTSTMSERSGSICPVFRMEKSRVEFGADGDHARVRSPQVYPPS